MNPTDQDAERLQALWNAKGKARHNEAKEAGRLSSDYQPSGVRRMTQAEYSGASKGNFSHLDTVHVTESGQR